MQACAAGNTLFNRSETAVSQLNNRRPNRIQVKPLVLPMHGFLSNTTALALALLLPVSTAYSLHFS
jgi:hypothetical protein